jgi:phosphatidylserine/phosphatidylglycerophosphate/cardiolipin synthase-like enzyme
LEALFTSLVGGARLRRRVLEVIAGAAATAKTRPVDVHVMTFAFTDRAIADLLVDAARRRPRLTIRVIADWSQGAEGAGRQVRRIAGLGLPNVVVRYKNDQPYAWDPGAERMRWSYHASRGLLHHKTLAVFVEGEPRTLVCGSFNWTTKAANGYENLVVLDADEPASVDVMAAVEREFEAMWTDGRVTLSAHEVTAQYDAILREYRRHPQRAPGYITSVAGGAGAPPPAAVVTAPHPAAPDASPSLLIAFSSRAPHQVRADAGYAEENRARRFELHKPSGKVKQAPVTLTNLALDVLARARAGERLLVAMYGLSPRVPEYGALLDAARRGVRVQVVLDGHVGRSVLVQLATVAHREGLPIRLRAGARMMHEKYVVHPEADTVLSGTANLSTDATRRHTEHRLVCRCDPLITAAFIEDFAALWARLPSPFRAGALVATTG